VVNWVGNKDVPAYSHIQTGKVVELHASEAAEIAEQCAVARELSRVGVWPIGHDGVRGRRQGHAGRLRGLAAGTTEIAEVGEKSAASSQHLNAAAQRIGNHDFSGMIHGEALGADELAIAAPGAAKLIGEDVICPTVPYAAKEQRHGS